MNLHVVRMLSVVLILVALPVAANAGIRFHDERPGVFVQVLRRNDFAFHLDMQDYSREYPLLRPATLFDDSALSWRTLASTPQSIKREVSLRLGEVVRFSNVRANYGGSGNRHPALSTDYIDDVIELFKRNKDVILHYSDPTDSGLKLADFDKLLRSANITGFELDTRNEKLFDSDWVADLLENPNLTHLALNLPDIESKTLLKMGNFVNLRSLDLRLGNPYKKWDGEDLARMIQSMHNLTQFSLVYSGDMDLEKAFTALGTRKQIRKLYLEGNFWKYEPFKHIAKAPSLEWFCYVNAAGFKLTDELQHLMKMPILSHLEIHGATKLERRHLEQFSEMQLLNTLRIGGRSDAQTDLGGISATDWVKIFKSKIRTLWVEAAGFRDVMIESLDRVKNLQTLVLSGDMSQISNSAWERLLRCHSLAHIEIDDNGEGIALSSVGAVLKSRTLKHILIRNLTMTKEDRFGFSLPNKITHLDLELANFPDGALRKARWEFETLDNLLYLSISCPTWVVQSDALKYFDECRKLKSLVLSASDIEDPLAFAISTDAFHHLDTLCLTGFKLTEAAMKRIEDRRELKVFAFAPDDIEAVKRISNLRELQNLALRISGDILLDFTPHALKDVDDLKQLKSLMLAIDEPGDFMFDKLLGETSDSKAEDVCINYGPNFKHFSCITWGATSGLVVFPLPLSERATKPKE